jgi:hypothetical protein
MADKDKDDWLDPEIVAADYPELPGLPEEDDKTYLWPDGSPVSERSLPRHAPVSREGQTVHVLGPEPTHLGAAILAIFLGAWPLAIPAIVYGNRVGSTWARGDFEESARMSRLAGNWALAAYVPTLLLLALGLITAIVTSIASA